MKKKYLLFFLYILVLVIFFNMAEFNFTNDYITYTSLLAIMLLPVFMYKTIMYIIRLFKSFTKLKLIKVFLSISIFIFIYKVYSYSSKKLNTIYSLEPAFVGEHKKFISSESYPEIQTLMFENDSICIISKSNVLKNNDITIPFRFILSQYCYDPGSTVKKIMYKNNKFSNLNLVLEGDTIIISTEYSITKEKQNSYLYIKNKLFIHNGNIKDSIVNFTDLSSFFSEKNIYMDIIHRIQNEINYKPEYKNLIPHLKRIENELSRLSQKY